MFWQRCHRQTPSTYPRMTPKKPFEKKNIRHNKSQTTKRCQNQRNLTKTANNQLRVLPTNLAILHTKENKTNCNVFGPPVPEKRTPMFCGNADFDWRLGLQSGSCKSNVTSALTEHRFLFQSNTYAMQAPCRDIRAKSKLKKRNREHKRDRERHR